MPETLAVTVSLTTTTCYRGHLWAVPYWTGSSPCPFCANEELESMRRKERLAALRIAALKGVISRQKRRTR